MLLDLAENDRSNGRAQPLVLSNARIVLADEIVTGAVRIQNGVIAGIDTGSSSTGDIDLAGDYLIPGLVDVHTDHFEKHVYPRPHVRWDFTRAALAHDAQIIGGGVTTVFDSICVGATNEDPERAHLLTPMVDALEKAQGAGVLRAEHFVHLRCEITDEETPALAKANIGRPIVRLMSVMEHLPGIRQSRDMDSYFHRAVKATGESLEVVRRRVERMITEKTHVGALVRPQVVALAKAHGLPLLSHDDTDIEHIDLAADEGVTISEFPCTLEAALEARRRGMLTIGGAPNVVRGGSQSGNIAVHDLLVENLVDILASDYVPRSMLDAAFMIADDPTLDFDLPAALRMVTKTPAEAAGLSDRGEIAIGKRADLVRVGVHEGHPYPKQIWREGTRVA